MQYFLLNCINIHGNCIFIRKLFVSLSLKIIFSLIGDYQDQLFRITKIRICPMEKWRNFFLQQMGTGTGGSSHAVYESVATWGVWCKSIPFKIFDKVKAPAKRTWYDEHGDDEYIPSEGLYLEAYTMKVEFGCKKMTSVNDVRQKVGQFLEYLRSSGYMKLYSSHTRIGRQNVRLDSVSDNATWKTDDEGEFLVFEVTFNVGDPKTDITL